jgi:uncharacterized protein (TIGR02588 family)
MGEHKAVGEDTPVLEWIFGAIGLVLFLGALGVTIVNGLAPPLPPAISVRTEQPQAVEGRFRVEFEALNKGSEAAALVQLHATLKHGDAILETHTVEIDLLAPNSSRRAGVFFTQDPAQHTLTVEAVSYQRP